MKVVKILSLLVLMNFVSCSTDENEAENNLKSYNSLYMDYINLYNGSSGSVKLEYDSKNKIIKRIGGLTPFVVVSNSYIFSPEVTEDIVYTNNEIKITRNVPNCSVCLFERKMILDNKNRVIKKIIYNQAPYLNDSIFYTYNNLDQIEETLKLYGKPKYLQYKFYQKAKYYYNQQQNLDSIVTVNFEEGPIVSGNDIYRTVEKFSNFDNASNPLKKLIIFDETYFRALSKNNYAKYEQLSYKNNQLYGSKISNFQYKYDSSGNIQFDFVQ